MNHSFPAASPYQAGGSLPADAPTYIERQADADLWQALLAGEYCYILNSRQMGKSSLRIRAMKKLVTRGIKCTEIELSGIGSQEITAQQWYGGIIQELKSGLCLKVNRRSWLREREDLSPVQRLGEFIATVILPQCDRQIVIFIDEIDSVLSLNFPTDEFFALLRHCYDLRATKPEYRRLSFVLLGVATPSELIQDQHATPFNIGKAIELQGLQLDESASLALGFKDKVPNPQRILQEILYWTGGQPFLTQKLCQLITHNSREINSPQAVKQLVMEQIIDNWEAQDEPEHLRTIRDRILRNSPSSLNLLQLYQQILNRKTIKAKNCSEHLELRLSGLVTKQRGHLTVKNPIYQAVFNPNWVKQQITQLNPEASIIPWWIVPGISILVTLLVLGVRSLGWLQPWELQAFDSLMRLRPQEKLDSRLLLVMITEEDVRSQPFTDRGGTSLSDRALSELLTKLESAQPRAIGLDLYRDFPVGEKYPALATLMKTSDHFFNICRYGNPGVIPAPEVPSNRQGFNNVLLDPDRVLRRHLLAVNSASPCQNKYSLNWQLATSYLAQEGIYPQINGNNYLQLGETVFKTLESNSGAYHNLDARGHQILLNYRTSSTIAPTFTLQEILSDRFDLNLIKDRLVLIGTNAPSFNDNNWRSPYSTGKWSVETISGVEIQTQMVSQILSAVLDGRPLISWLSKPQEYIWIWLWSLAGGILVWRFPDPLSRVWVILGGTTCILGVSCWLLLLVNGVWLPLVPSVMVLFGTGSSIVIVKKRLEQVNLPAL